MGKSLPGNGRAEGMNPAPPDRGPGPCGGTGLATPSARAANAYPPGMKDSEFVQRVIGILTEAKQLAALPEEEGAGPDSASDNMISLLNELLDPVELPVDAPADELRVALSQQVGGIILKLVGSFSAAFVELAQVHDSGRADVTSADVLQALALRVETLPSDDDE